MKTIRESLMTLASFFAGASVLSFLSYTQKTVVGYPHLIMGYAIPFMIGGLLGATIFILYRRKTSSNAVHQAFNGAHLTYSLLFGSVSLCLFSA
ncbi:MAG: hypothetical protein J7K75_01045, partial [Desulfuromonas sp.]|nr:hypothetical protein [Desulfuromonas sp.]